MISIVLHPASASRRAAAFRRPWRTQRSGTPEAPILSAIQLPNPFDVNGCPYRVVRITPWRRGVVRSASWSWGWIGMTMLSSLASWSVFFCVSVIVPAVSL
nr:hypothetical protein [Inquilinus limosus]